MNLWSVSGHDHDSVRGELHGAFAGRLQAGRSDDEDQILNLLQVRRRTTDDAIQRIDDVQQAGAHFAVRGLGFFIRLGRQEKLRQLLDRR